MGSGVLFRGHRPARPARTSFSEASHFSKHAGAPVLVSKWLVAADLFAKDFKFRRCLWNVETRNPVPRPRHRPRCQPRRFGVVLQLPETAPFPVFCAFDERGPAGIALDIAAHPQKVIVGGDRNRPEAALVHRALAVGAVNVTPAPRVGGR